jgi:hypothetical protein
MTLDLGYLRSILNYSALNGDFRWKVSRRGTKGLGELAGKERKDRYRLICIDGRKYLAHRLAWFYVRGVWPDREIDHVNGDPADNRFINLREAKTSSQQRANSLSPKPNVTGFRGVELRPSGRWAVRISCGYKRTYLGMFDCPKKASEAYEAKAKELFGEFALSVSRQA